MCNLKYEIKSLSRFLGLSAMFFVAGSIISPVNATVYDFEALPNGVLQGRDGWQDEPDSGLLVTRPDSTLENGTQVVQPDLGVISGWTAVLNRPNNETFRFSPFFGNETQAVEQFDVTGEAAAGFGLGNDVDGDGRLSAVDGELGPVFGTLRSQTQGIEQFALIAANFGATYLAPLNNEERCCNEDGDWYRLQLRMDFTANNGAGSGSLYYMNLSNGDTRFKPVSELQYMNLKLDSMHQAATPQFWSSMWISMRFEGAQSLPKLDNLTPRLPNVMQSNGDLSIQGVDGMDAFGAKFDVILQAVSKDEDPAGLFWQLKQVREASPETPSTSTLSSTLDLILDAVDVSALYPDLGTVTGACLQFQGWDDLNPSTMTWKYVSVDCQ